MQWWNDGKKTLNLLLMKPEYSSINTVECHYNAVQFITISWWRHQMETFSALLAIWAGNSPVPGEFPAQRPMTRSFDVFFDLHLNKRLSKQSWGWWFETLSCPLWRHRNVIYGTTMTGAELKSDHRLTTNTPYLTLMCELCGVYCEDFGDN